MTQKNLILLLSLNLLLGSMAFGAVWSYSGTGPWNPQNLKSFLAVDYMMTVSLEAVVSESPAEITLKIYSDREFAATAHPFAGDHTYKVFRKDPDALEWGEPIGDVVTGLEGAPAVTTDISSWVDTNVTVGVVYEYGLAVVGPGLIDGKVWYRYLNANILAGIKVDRTESKGRMAVVVTDDIVAHLPEEYAQYKTDLVRDGWTLHEMVVARSDSYVRNGTGPLDANGIPTAPFPDEHLAIKSQLVSLYTTYSNELKNVVLVGKVPVVRSGTGNVDPDGHGNRSACGADVYYADMDGVWTDATNNLAMHANIGLAVNTGRINVEGDYKFDEDRMSEVASSGPVTNASPELGFGRIDFSNQIAAEYEATRTYFNKLHRYKMAAPDFQPGRRGIIRGHYDIVTHTFLGSLPSLLGMTELDFTSKDDLPEAPTDGTLDSDQDADYSRDLKPYLFYFKGDQVPGDSEGSRAVFWTGMQSHWGYWFEENVNEASQNSMQRRLSEDNFTLSYTWSISVLGGTADTHYLYHRLGMGGNAGNMMRASMSNRSGSIHEVYSPAKDYMYMNHMGDPALRIYMMAPPTDFQVLSSGGNPSLSWIAPVAVIDDPPLLGYHIYRASNSAGPFTRLTSSILPGTSYTDTTASSGEWHYQVKAIRLEPSGGSSYYNSSLAAQQSIDLTNGPDPLAINIGVVLPEANWDTDYELELTAIGGTPLLTWSVDANDLPTGLTLSASGVLAGKPTDRGTFSFTASVADAAGQTDQMQLTLTVLDFDVQVVEPEAGGAVSPGNPFTAAGAWISTMKVSGASNNDEGYLRFDLSGIHTNDYFEQAKLVLFADGLTPNNSPIVLKVSLGEDADDGWLESSLNYYAIPAINPSIPVVTATHLLVPHEAIELDITAMVAETLANDPAQKLTLRIYTETAVANNDAARIANRYACKLARPRLLVNTFGTDPYVEPPPPLPATNTFTVISDVEDSYIWADANEVLTVMWPVGSGVQVLAIANDDPQWSDNKSCAIVVFQLPDLDGYPIRTANAAADIEVWNPPGGSDPFPKGVDLYAVRMAADPAVSTADYGYKGSGLGTLIQANVLVIPSNVGIPYTIYNTDASGDSALATWLADQYAAGAKPGSYAFLRYEANGDTSGKVYLRAGDNTDPLRTKPTLTIEIETPEGYDAWASGFEWNGADWAPEANPMQDGYPNLLKYTLGFDPLSDYIGSPYEPYGQMQLNSSSNWIFTYTFTHDTTAVDATQLVEGTSDLTSNSWIDIDPLDPANQVSVLEDTPEVDIQTITIKDTQPNATNRFLRLKATRP
ncbi:MAG: hypothetical protein DRP64_00870 [Verrucomicrobia bacterium]|nr:MAG: hypothetical protein DRP64_00870 [Verrucomicrobiota bacterium]